MPKLPKNSYVSTFCYTFKGLIMALRVRKVPTRDGLSELPQCPQSLTDVMLDWPVLKLKDVTDRITSSLTQ